MIDNKRLIKLTGELIAIDSQNPPGNEAPIAGYVKTYLGAIGIPSRIYEFAPKRCSIVATLKGKGRRSLLITPHLDTVPAGLNWKTQPFVPSIKGGRLFGLGSTDCKGNLAVSLEVINSLVEEGVKLDYTIVFAATGDEEAGSDLGLVPLLRKKILKVDAALVLDADGFKIVVTQKGLMHLKIKVRGKKAHGAYPWLGENAIDLAVDMIHSLRCIRHRIKKNVYLKPSTMNVGTIRGGDKVNVVSDWCEFELDFRFLPGESAQEILSQIRRIAVKHTRNFKVEIEGIQAPYNIGIGHPLVQGLIRAWEAQGITPEIEGSEGATTISFFQNERIPAVATGFGCEGCAHIADEYVEVSSLYRGAKALEVFLKNYRFAQS